MGYPSSGGVQGHDQVTSIEAVVLVGVEQLADKAKAGINLYHNKQAK